MQSERILWIDLAKGMSIILVALGHWGLSGIPVVGEWFTSFRMPLFFFVSGILLSTKYDLKTFLKKRGRALILPYFYFSLIVFSCFLMLGIKDVSDFNHVILYGWGGYALWFIPVLVFTQLFWFVIRKNFNHFVSFVLIVFSAIIGYLLSIRTNNFPYNLLLVFTSVFFFGIGNLLKETLICLFRKNITYLISYSLMFFLFSLFYLFDGSAKINYSGNELGLGIPTIVSGLGGALLICAIANILLKGSSIKWSFFLLAGKNSYIILAFHQLILSICSIYLKPSITVHYIYKLIELSIVSLSCWLLIICINRYFPWLIGKNSSKNF